VTLNGVMMGLSRREARTRLDAVLDFSELREFVDLKLKNYSSGMSVRLAFAVLVQLEADILLIDEVLAVGDAAFQQKCIDTLNRMHEEGRTIVLVTHDMNAVEQFCDRAVLFEEGTMIALGDPQRISHNYTQINFDRARALAEVERPRYGNGDVQVEAAWFADADGQAAEMLEQLQPCSFHMRIAVRRDVPAASFGVSITDAQNRNVFTTSTTYMGQRTGPLAAGEELELTVRFDNRFAPGRYFATPLVASESDAQLMDLREQFATVVVTGQRRSGGLVDLQHEISFERVGASAAPVGAEEHDGGR